MKPFQLTLKAKSDLKDIALFTSRRWGREQRNVYLKQFDDSFWLLAENPDIGKSCDDIRDGYKKFPQGSHVIFYEHYKDKYHCTEFHMLSVAEVTII